MQGFYSKLNRAKIAFFSTDQKRKIYFNLNKKRFINTSVILSRDRKRTVNVTLQPLQTVQRP